jgi:DHA2 family multidrug resistance protein
VAVGVSEIENSGQVNRPLITVCVMLATVIQALDATIANVALPHMQASLGATRESVTWVLTSYIVASAVATPASGWLADRFGTRTLFLFSVGGFVVTSMLCGIATNLTEMVVFRIAQGLSGAALVPISQTMLLGIYPKEKHGFAIAIWGMAVMISPIMGPILGGWLTDDFNWRWVFYVNLPIGLIALLGGFVSIPKWRQSPRKFDMFGFATFAIAVLALQTLLDRGAGKDWFQSWEIIIEAGVAAGAFWMFMVHLGIARTRLFQPRMLTDTNYSTAIFFTFLISGLAIGGAALLPPMLQQLFGYPTVSAGLLIAPRGLGTFISMLLVGQLSRRVDLRLFLVTGMVLISLSLYIMMGFSLDMDQWPIVTSGFIQGLGLGFCIVPTNLLAFQSIPPALRTDASALYSLMRSLGGSVGISFVTTILARQTQVSHSDLAANITGASVQGFDSWLAVAANPLLGQAPSLIDLEINRQALMIAYIDDYRIMMLATLFALPLLLMIRSSRGKTSGEPLPVE